MGVIIAPLGLSAIFAIKHPAQMPAHLDAASLVLEHLKRAEFIIDQAREVPVAIPVVLVMALYLHEEAAGNLTVAQILSDAGRAALVVIHRVVRTARIGARALHGWLFH